MLCNDDQKVNELHGVVKSMRNIERSLTRKKVSKAIVLPPLAEFLQANGLSMIAESMTEWDLRTMLNTCNEMQFEIDFQFLPTPIRRRLQQALRDQLEEYEELPPASPPPPPPRPPPIATQLAIEFTFRAWVDARVVSWRGVVSWQWRREQFIAAWLGAVPHGNAVV